MKRFLEFWAEVRRTQNIKMACALSVPAVFIVFALCYTLIPRSWNSVAGLVEPDRIMGTQHVIKIDHGKLSIDLWQIDEKHEWEPDTIHAFLDSLQTASYRAELRNVLNYTPLGQLLNTSAAVTGGTGMLILSFMEDNAVTVRIHLCDVHDHIVLIETKGNPNTFFYHVDGELYDTLAAWMEEYGTKR